jgi:hypothetical protein
MANTLTGLIPVIYEAMDVIPRELIAGISAVQRDSSADQAALNQTIRSHVVPTMSMVDVTPGVTNTNGIAQTIGYADLQITKSKNVPFVWAGEEQMAVSSQYAGIVRDQFAQAFRTLANAMELDVVAAAAAGASRAIGTAGTTPFGTATSMADFANAVQVLDDNGAPQGDRSMLLGTTAAASIRANQTILLKANEAGSSSLLRGGDLGRVLNMGVGATGQIGAGAAVGTGASYVINGAHAVGATSITVKTGTGTVLTGDVVTIGGYKYVVTGAGIAAPGAFTINAPGLKVAAADGATVTVNAASVKNVFLQKAGFLLATRLPAMPLGGDSASDLTVVTDPVSGLSFQVALYKQYRQITIDVAIAWGTKVIRPDYVGVLLG